MLYGTRTVVFMFALMTGFAGDSALTADKTPTAATGPVAAMSRLSPKLQKLLIEEMVAINAASQKIVAALVSGDTVTVAKQAQGIHDSFILEKKLSKEDSAALEQALPQGFLVLDAMLHGRAQRLANVAQHGDLELTNFFFGRMIETCQSCHSRFATNRFPGFAPPAQAGKKK